MQYFKKELYINHSHDDEWIQNMNEYKRVLKSMENRFSKKVFKFILSKSFHDSEILSIELKHQNKGKYPLEVIIKVCDGEQMWKITYKKITRVSLNIPTTDGVSHFGLWGYNEFLPVDDEVISHEIMMIPQCDTIKIEFKNKNIYIEKIT
ncbi:hypothetical protein ACFSO7_09575 [Bacillus sp. CGMCC 1.16607]|uniref:hypothetical protein n=1 Tax=Bacillus sp. CGMCC 1.16607 TaxID=3351842 RepID=UPI00364276AD